MTDARFLLDSNICIYILDDAHSMAAERLQLCDPGEAVVSSITYAEVALGIPRTPDALTGFAALFEVVPVIAFDRAAAWQYALLPFKRARFDRLVAAHALALDLTLVTNDTTDFVDIPGLKLENWT